MSTDIKLQSLYSAYILDFKLYRFDILSNYKRFCLVIISYISDFVVI